MRALAAQVKILCKENHLYANSFEEHGWNPVFGGRNWNAGEVIESVLRSLRPRTSTDYDNSCFAKQRWQLSQYQLVAACESSVVEPQSQLTMALGRLSRTRSQ